MSIPMRSVFIMLRTVKMKYFLIPFAFLVIYLLFFYFFIEKSFSYYRASVRHSSVVLSYVVVHLDLKGAPPKLSYLESLLPKFKHLGVNGILMEYEDMFPYEGRLVNLSSKYCYKKNELKKFIDKSVDLGIEIIPLIQTLGHMEHVLKLQEFMHLREIPLYPDSICPSNQESLELLKDMLEQVIHFHTGIVPLKHIHVGCDEVYHMNKCDKCRKQNAINVKLFINHLNYVNKIVRKYSPGTNVLIWDDMLREKRWIGGEFNTIEPVYWDYKQQLAVSHSNMYYYHMHFKNIWIASAFKGADGITATMPHITNRYINNLYWLDYIMDYKFAGESKVFNFKGIILTGWSRYSHMDPLCELLPVSIPSLFLNLLLIQRMRGGIQRGDSAFMDTDDFFAKYLQTNFKNIFKCKKLNYLDDFDNTLCEYEDSELLNVLLDYLSIQADITRHFDETILYAIEYYYNINRLNINNVQRLKLWCKDTLKRLKICQKRIKLLMSRYYDDYVIKEYVGYKTNDLERKLKNTLQIMKKYLVIRAWKEEVVLHNNSIT